MNTSMVRSRLLLVVLLSGTPTNSSTEVFGQSLSPGYTFSLYASVPAPPMQLVFNSSGDLFVAKSGADSFIHQVSPGGSPVVAIGPRFSLEPISVQVDQTGLFSGIPDAVIVGGRDRTGRDMGHRPLRRHEPVRNDLSNRLSGKQVHHWKWFRTINKHHFWT